MDVTVRRDARDLVRGALGMRVSADGWARPSRLTRAQLAEVGGMAAWHPRLYREMAGCTSGVRLDFVTDSAHVALEVEADALPAGSRAMIADLLRNDPEARPPFDGFSFCCEGRRLGGVRMPEPDGGLIFALGFAPGKTRRAQIWLPCLSGCALRGVFGDGTFIEPAPAPAGTLLVLGDSIAQGFTALDPAATWPALLADRLGLGLIDQGIGGQVFQPGSVADAASLVSPSLVVVEFGANYRFEPCRAEAVERDARAYFSEICRAWPGVPVLALTPLFHTEALYPTHPGSCFADVARIIREATAAHGQVCLVDGDGILPTDPAVLADGSDHPGPLGQVLICEKLMETVSFLDGKTAGKRQF